MAHHSTPEDSHVTSDPMLRNDPTDDPTDDLMIVDDEHVRALFEQADTLAGREAYSSTQQRLELLETGRSARKREKYTQKGVARTMQTEQSTISHLERGRTDPRLSTLQRYGQAIGSPLQISFDVPKPDRPPEAFASETLARLLTKLVHKSTTQQSTTEEALATALAPVPRDWTRRLLLSLQDVGWARSEVINDQESFFMAEDAAALIGLSLHRDRVEGSLTDLSVTGTTNPISTITEYLEDRGIDAVLSASVSLIKALRFASTRPVVGVGVSVAGLVDSESGKVLYAPSLESKEQTWQGVHFEKMLQERVQDEIADIKVAVENDVNALGLSEYLRTGSESQLVVLMSGVGIGASYLNHGKLINGAHNAVCELGHTVVRPEGPPCRAGMQNHNGCIETVSSTAGILQELGLPSNDAEALKKGLVFVNQQISDGDTTVSRVVGKAGYEIGTVVGDASRYLDPGTITLYAHPYLTDRQFESAVSFQQGFDAGFERSCRQRLDFLPSVVTTWLPLKKNVRAGAAARAAFWHFLQTPLRWSPGLEGTVRNLYRQRPLRSASH